MAGSSYDGGNFLLDMLPMSELNAISPFLECVSAGVGDTLYDDPGQGQRDYVYFPIDAVASMIVTLRDGSAVEAGTVGREGVTCGQTAFGSPRVREHWISQVPGRVTRMLIGDFRSQFGKNEVLRGVVQRYVQTYIAFLTQSAACNNSHMLLERCARWLLLTRDRVGRDDFFLTHEFLSIMLGSRRAGVSIAAEELKKAGFISYSRGHMNVKDRIGLESAACECYRITTDEYRRVFSEMRATDGIAAVPRLVAS